MLTNLVTLVKNFVIIISNKFTMINYSNSKSLTLFTKKKKKTLTPLRNKGCVWISHLEKLEAFEIKCDHYLQVI